SVPGDLNFDGASNTSDLLALTTALNNGSAGLLDQVPKWCMHWGTNPGHNPQDQIPAQRHERRGSPWSTCSTVATITACP
ncbi:MAG TPA: hypothetical protein VGM03_17095, partial [Phycisphaerae bacterium]